MKIREDVPISELTTMRLGGRARYVLEIQSVEDVAEAYRFARAHDLPIWMMGGGANTIGRDEGFDGVIFLNRIKGIFVKVGDQLVPAEDFDFTSSDELALTAMGGEVWDDVVDFVSERGFSGCEAMSLIPGTVGAAPVQNIGAYGQDMSQIIESVEAFDLKTGKTVVLEKSDLQMGYRHTRLNFGKDAGRFFIVSVTMTLRNSRLKPPFYNSLQRYIDTHNETDFSPKNIRRIVCEIRNAKLPDPEFVASAGSFFKNVYVDKQGADEAAKNGIPVWRDAEGNGKINSGWLIEECGLKGKLIHGFRVSDKAALVLINESAKSYADLALARKEIINKVREKFGFELEQEPVEITD